MYEDFRFAVSQWHSVVQSEIFIPTDAEIRCILDPALTCNPSSDRSALVAGFTHTREDGINEFNLLDGVAGRYCGAKLAEAALDFLCKWKPLFLRIEGIPGSELLRDTILMKAHERGLDSVEDDSWKPRVQLFPYNVTKGAKNNRIIKLQSLFNPSPPAIRIQRCSYLQTLFEEIEAFVPSSQNRGRKIDFLDACALCAGFR